MMNHSTRQIDTICDIAYHVDCLIKFGYFNQKDQFKRQKFGQKLSFMQNKTIYILIYCLNIVLTILLNTISISSFKCHYRLKMGK